MQNSILEIQRLLDYLAKIDSIIIFKSQIGCFIEIFITENLFINNRKNTLKKKN